MEKTFITSITAFICSFIHLIIFSECFLCVSEDTAMNKKDTDFGLMEFIVIEQLQHLVNNE